MLIREGESMTVLLLEFAPAGFKDSQKGQTNSFNKIHGGLDSSAHEKHIDIDKICSI